MKPLEFTYYNTCGNNWTRLLVVRDQIVAVGAKSKGEQDGCFLFLANGVQIEVAESVEQVLGSWLEAE